VARGPPDHDHPGDGRNRCCRSGGSHRRHQEVPHPPPPGGLPRAGRPGPPVRIGPSPPWRHLQAGLSEARHLLVEARWAAVRTPGPLRAFGERIRARRGANIAIVAVARKLAVLCWHLLSREEDYAFARPSLVREKVRRLELSAGVPRRPGQRNPIFATPAQRRLEREIGVQAERVPQVRQGLQSHRQGRVRLPPQGRTSLRPARARQRGTRDKPQTLLFARGHPHPPHRAEGGPRCPHRLEFHS